jgi:heme-degrading monooxygenase HmoA
VIVRLWRGRAAVTEPEAYAQHAIGHVFPELSQIPGFRGAYLLRQTAADDADTLEFVVMTFWESIEAVKQFAGDDVSSAVVEPEGRAALADWDPFVRHYELVHDSVRLPRAAPACT